MHVLARTVWISRLFLVRTSQKCEDIRDLNGSVSRLRREFGVPPNPFAVKEEKAVPCAKADVLPSNYPL